MTAIHCAGTLHRQLTQSSNRLGTIQPSFVVVVGGGGGGGSGVVVLCPLRENSGCLTWVRHSSHKSSATHSYQCVQYSRVFKQWYNCQCLGFLTYTQMLMHAIAHGGCTDTVRGSALKVDSGRKNPLPYRGSEPASVLRLACQSDALPTELSPPLTVSKWTWCLTSTDTIKAY